MSETDEDVQDLPVDPETEPGTETDTATEVATEPDTTTETETETEPYIETPRGTEQTQVSQEESEQQRGEGGEGGVGRQDLPGRREREEELIYFQHYEDGEEEGQEEEECDLEEPSIYDSADFISGPQISENGTLPMDILDFQYSYGYNCRKYFNLAVLDENTVAFGSGNFLNFFNVETREIWFRRSALGGAIGNIRQNPNEIYPYFAVAECGWRPIIIMYEWPSLEIVCVLKGGSTKIYSNMDFSPDGVLLVSQAGDPDYLITIWTWLEHKILLRSKSYVNDVYRVKFSPYVPGQLTSCGLAHIKFWKMAHTFTGLKLKGELGRFGKTEYTDILGVLPMPDEKVISGSSWGNILIWDGGLIVLEVFRSLRRRCHDAPIVQCFYDVDDGELWSVSMDGHIRVWWYEIIDQADPPDDDRIVQLDPSYDFYTPGVMLMCIEKRFAHDLKDTWYFGQDGNGGIWLIDLNTEVDPQPSIQLYKCHAGEVIDLAASPIGPFFASMGRDGRLYVYNYLKNKRVFDYNFPAKGACLIWLPLNIMKFGDTILAGFDDGQIRVCLLKISGDDKVSLIIRQVTKPHNKPLTKMSVNPPGTILVSGGEDCTIFIYKVFADANHNEDLLTPIGFIPSPDIVTYITWHYYNDAEVLVGCLHGKMMQVIVPDEVQHYTGVSYCLRLIPKLNSFKTYKAQIRRDIKVAEIEARKAAKLVQKMEDLERVKKENPGLEIDEDVFLADSESEEILEPLHIPEVPNKILWLQYTDDNTIWLSMGGYDAGYIYEYYIDQKDDIPYRFKMVDDADDIEISSYVYTYDREYLIFAMEDGVIRVNKVNKKDFRDLSDYWTLPMHDNQQGFIPQMCFSYDEEYFFTCGYDGNVFAYKFQPDDYTYPEPGTPQARAKYPTSVKDVDTYAKLSLEDTKIKAENDRIQKLANEHKAEMRETLKSLRDRFGMVISRNVKLLPSQVIPRDELELDPRVTEYVDEAFKDKLELVKRKLAYDQERSEIGMKKLLKYLTDPVDYHPITVKAINNPKLELMTVRQRVMAKKFYQLLTVVEQKILAEQDKGRPPERTKPPPPTLPPKVKKTSALEYFLLSLTPSVIEHNLGPKLSRTLDKYRERRIKWEKRSEEWERFLAKKPIPGNNHPDDEKLLEEARDTIGDYKLKEGDDYKLPRHLRETTVKKYKQLMDARLKQYNIRHKYCEMVYEVRDEKYAVIKRLLAYKEKLKEIQEELPEELHKSCPNIPEFDPTEYPEKNLVPEVILPHEEFDTADIVKPIFVDKSPNDDKDELEALPERPTFPIVNKSKGIFLSTHPTDLALNIVEQDFNKLIQINEDVDTPYEMDQRVKRLNRKIFYQSQIISYMNKEIDLFNEKVYEGKKKRLPILMFGNFIDLFILTLNQELDILKKCEDKEDQLAEIVNENLSHVHEMQDTLDNLRNQKQSQEANIENFQIEAFKIQDKFRHSTESNKFYDFLKKVFKKKFKPPKLKTDDESSSESSSSSSSEEEEDDNASLDSRDFGIIRQDLNVCPKGCEPAIFNLTIDLRSKRHEIEQSEREEYRTMEAVKKDIEMNLKKLNLLQNQYQASQKELEIFQREKQKEMNQVLCVVLLNIDQSFGFNPDQVDITELLVFSKTRLRELYERVGVLQRETYEQKSKFDTYLKHGTRMRKDINYMTVKIKELKREIVDTMLEKFGQVIDISEVEAALIQRSFQKSQVNDLEEVVLKKMVFDLRVKTADISALFIDQLKIVQAKISRAQHELSLTIRENTKRLELLQAISKEKKELSDIILSQPRKRANLEKMGKSHKRFLEGVEKLENIIEGQCMELCQLKNEIKMLKTKGLPPRGPICQADSKTQEREEAYEADIGEWVDYDKYIDEQYEDTREKLYGADITIPGFYSTESKDIVVDFINMMLENLDSALATKSKEHMVESILSGILRCVSVEEIIMEIINNLPFAPNDQQQSIVEVTAEKLFSLQEPEINEDSFIECANDILDDVIDEVMLTKGEPHEVLAKIVQQLVESLPYDYLMSKEANERMIKKMIDTIGCICLNKEDMKKEIEKIPSELKQEMMPILNTILEGVYGMGMDYFFVQKL